MTRQYAVWPLSFRLVLAVLVGVLAIAVTDKPSAAIDNPLVRAPLLGSFTTGGCGYYCRSCGKNLHDIVTAVDTNAESSHLENCNTGECSSHNCSSQELGQRVADLWAEVLNTDAADLPQLVERNADIATYNEHRHAIQMHCAEGNLVASLPLSDSQIAALE